VYIVYTWHGHKSQRPAALVGQCTLYNCYMLYVVVSQLKLQPSSRRRRRISSSPASRTLMRKSWSTPRPTRRTCCPPRRWSRPRSRLKKGAPMWSNPIRDPRSEIWDPRSDPQSPRLYFSSRRISLFIRIKLFPLSFFHCYQVIRTAAHARGCKSILLLYSGCFFFCIIFLYIYFLY